MDVAPPGSLAYRNNWTRLNAVHVPSRLKAPPPGRPVTVLIASDILIEVSRGRDKAMAAQWLELDQSDALLLYSAVSAAKLWAGARPSEYAVLDALLCVPIEAALGRRGAL